MKFLLSLVAAVVGSASFDFASAADCRALTGARVYPVALPSIPSGTVVIEDDRITAVGGAETVIPSGCTVVSLPGKHIFPGLINSHTQLGLVEVGAVAMTDDANEKFVVNGSHFQASDAVRIDSRNAPIALKEGVTLALSSPGTASVFAGQGALLSLGQVGADKFVLASNLGLHINLGDSPLENTRPRNQMPTTRMGIASTIRQTFISARQYQERRRANPNTPHDAAYEVVIKALDRSLPVYFRAISYSDVRSAINLTNEFSLRSVLVRGGEAYQAASELAQAGIPVIVAPITAEPTRFETRAVLYENVGILLRAGVKVAIATGGATDTFKLRNHAGLAVNYNKSLGFRESEALRAITLSAAEILGISNNYGSITAGKVANLVIANGSILNPTTRVEAVYVNGVEQSLRTWQEELRDQYRYVP